MCIGMLTMGQWVVFWLKCIGDDKGTCYAFVTSEAWRCTEYSADAGPSLDIFWSAKVRKVHFITSKIKSLQDEQQVLRAYRSENNNFTTLTPNQWDLLDKTIDLSKSFDAITKTSLYFKLFSIHCFVSLRLYIKQSFGSAEARKVRYISSEEACWQTVILLSLKWLQWNKII